MTCPDVVSRVSLVSHTDRKDQRHNIHYPVGNPLISLHPEFSDRCKKCNVQAVNFTAALPAPYMLLERPGIDHRTALCWGAYVLRPVGVLARHPAARAAGASSTSPEVRSVGWRAGGPGAFSDSSSPSSSAGFYSALSRHADDHDTDDDGHAAGHATGPAAPAGPALAGLPCHFAFEGEDYLLQTAPAARARSARSVSGAALSDTASSSAGFYSARSREGTGHDVDGDVAAPTSPRAVPDSGGGHPAPGGAILAASCHFTFEGGDDYRLPAGSFVDAVLYKLDSCGSPHHNPLRPYDFAVNFKIAKPSGIPLTSWFGLRARSAAG
jgi:hypothetical protein